MEAEWVLFLKSHKDAKPFKNHGWIHLKIMTELMPATLRGAHVYRPSQGITGMDAGVGLEDDVDNSDAEVTAEKDISSDEPVMSDGTAEVRLSFLS